MELSYEEAWKKHCIHTINLALERASPEKVSAIRSFVSHYIKDEYKAGLSLLAEMDDE